MTLLLEMSLAHFMPIPLIEKKKHDLLCQAMKDTIMHRQANVRGGSFHPRSYFSNRASLAPRSLARVTALPRGSSSCSNMIFIQVWVGRPRRLLACRSPKYFCDAGQRKNMF